MSELQEAIEETTGQLAHAKQAASYSVILNLGEAQLLVDAAQLVSPLQERCQLLGRALVAVWSLVGEEDQQAIMSVLDTPAGIEGVRAHVDKALDCLLNASGIVETLDLDQIGEAITVSLALHIGSMQRLQSLLKQQAEKVQP